MIRTPQKPSLGYLCQYWSVDCATCKDRIIKMAVEGYFFTPLVLLIIPKECHDEFFIKFNFFHAACFKLALSKVLGYGIVIGSSMIKIPQIIKVAAAGSVVGLSLMSFLTELVATTVTSAYSMQKSFPFSTWGESFFLSLQTSLLVVMYFHYNRRSSMAAVFLAVYAVCIYGLLSKYMSLILLTQLFSLNVPLMAISKVLQIVANFRHGHTGQLSFIMVFLLFIGAIARIFTTVQETGDTIMLATYSMTTILNGIMLAQVLFYWNVKVNVDHTKKSN
ncbi:mannose-P-dolichol utilization defect 1 protein-like [Actinia tenebrosa]|uniref:Mannose-P-dolichol utilization defect 1 protein homolog n=1 Tax=Actinia tenebrosa TaxID=6105 RepID=A0A6P8I805_ACTTE|nr:mannose-P-dolichol utilization defect 1 protein-like [Actinia tenebrosa]